MVVNEVVASSSDNNYLAGNDWIELFNRGSTTVNLSDYALADTDSAQISLPAISLAPGQYVVIAAADKDDPNPPSPSVPFKLGGEDLVSLYWRGDLISTLSWTEGQAPKGSSYGLLDGVAQTLEPTPGAANRAGNAGPIVRGNPSSNSPLRISEVVANSDRSDFYNGADWIELVNTGATAINLGEYRLTDDSNPLEALPNRTLQPGQRIVIIAGGSAPTDGAPHVTFGLGREDSLSIFRGNEEVDYVAWGRDQSQAGQSYGRLTNTSNQWVILYPTPGDANVAW